MPVKLNILDSVRGFASFYVVVHHFFGYTDLKSVIHPIFRFPFRFGQEAVIVFFILSGFAICISTYKSSMITFSQYFTKRFTRIYPIFIAVLIISIIISFLSGSKLTTEDCRDFLGNLFMLQDTGNKPGTFIFPFLRNHALWSLSYEWWFYMIFFPLKKYFLLIKHIYNVPTIYLVLLISSLAYILYIIFPNHLLLILSYLVLWWSGVYLGEIYCNNRKIDFDSLLPIYISLALMLFLSIIPIFIYNSNALSNLNVNDFPFIDFRHFSFALFVILIINIYATFKNIDFNKATLFSKISSISYALYCIHFPIILIDITCIDNEILKFFFKFFAIICLAYLLEVKLQSFAVKYIPMLLSKIRF